MRLRSIFTVCARKSKRGRSELPPCAVWATAWKKSRIRRICPHACHCVCCAAPRGGCLAWGGAAAAVVPSLQRYVFCEAADMTPPAVNIFHREQRSLFGEILDWMLTPLLLLWPLSLVLTWLIAQDIAAKPYDRALGYNVAALAQLITVSRNRVQFNLPQSAREILRADDADTVYYQVLGARGEYLSGEPDLPLPPAGEKVLVGEVRLRDGEVHDIDVKVAYTWVKLELPGARPALVQVAETIEKRSMLATEIVKGVMLPQFVILPMAVLLVWLALVQAIKPLNQLEERIRARNPDDLSPVSYTHLRAHET